MCVNKHTRTATTNTEIAINNHTWIFRNIKYIKCDIYCDLQFSNHRWLEWPDKSKKAKFWFRNRHNHSVGLNLFNIRKIKKLRSFWSSDDSCPDRVNFLTYSQPISMKIEYYKHTFFRDLRCLLKANWWILSQSRTFRSPIHRLGKDGCYTSQLLQKYFKITKTTRR